MSNIISLRGVTIFDYSFDLIDSNLFLDLLNRGFYDAKTYLFIRRT